MNLSHFSREFIILRENANIKLTSCTFCSNPLDKFNDFSVPQFIEPFLLQISREKLKSYLWVQEISIRFDDFIITRGRRSIEFEIDLQIKAFMNLCNDKFY